MSVRESRPAAWIALLYIFFSGLWVLLSDQILEGMIDDPELLSTFQTYKGWGYVLVSGLVLYGLLWKFLHEREQIEQAQRRTDMRYRQLVDHAADGIFTLDASGNLEEINRSGCDMLGYSHGDLVGKHVREIIPAEDQETLPLYRMEIETGKSLLIQQQMRRKDGALLPVEISASGLEDGRLQGIMRDISERQRVEQALRTWSDIFRFIRIGVATGGPEGKTFDLVNPAFAELHGYTVEELAGKEISIVFAPEERADLSEHIRLTHEKGHHIFESMHIRKDDTLFPALVDATAVKNSAGEVQYRITSVQDISERKQAEEQIQRNLKRLAALRAIDSAITSILDQRLLFNILLDQVVSQLHADAVSILLYKPVLRRLEFAAGRGFRSDSIQDTVINLGEGLAGRVVENERSFSMSSLENVADKMVRKGLVEGEGFRSYHGVPLIAKGVVKGVLEVFHRTPFAADKGWVDFLEALAGQAAIAIENIELYENLQDSTIELSEAYDATLEGWSRALEMRDQETQGHSNRVTELTLRLGEELGLTDEDLVHVRRGTLLHDIGKMGVPDQILLKPGPLTPKEWDVMRQHPVYAFQLISPIGFLRPALDIPYCHHERWDGSGYPRGLKGEQIPLAARIFMVVDVWDALRSDRTYREAWPMERVLRYIKERAGTHFDPQVTEAFLRLISTETNRQMTR